MIKEIERYVIYLLEWLGFRNSQEIEIIEPEIIDKPVIIPIINETEIIEPLGGKTIYDFLLMDSTDAHEYTEHYQCGHFSRDLGKNASEANVEMGCIILSHSENFEGYTNHAMNYVVDNDGEILLISPQSDRISKLKDTLFSYYILYPDCFDMPSRWKGRRTATGMIKDL